MDISGDGLDCRSSVAPTGAALNPSWHLYVAEPDSARSRAHASAMGPLLTRDITVGTAQPFYNQSEMDIAAAWVVVPVADSKGLSGFQSLVKKMYQRPAPLLTGTLDALHLAAAQAGHATELVTTDQRQAHAAVTLGLPIFT